MNASMIKMNEAQKIGGKLHIWEIPPKSRLIHASLKNKKERGLRYSDCEEALWAGI